MSNFKNLLLASLALVLVVGISSCGKGKTTKEKITGTWTVDERAYKYTSDGEVVEEGREPSGEKVTFNDDGTYVVEIDGDQEEGTYKLVGDDQITIDDETLDIQELTSKSMILYSKDTEDTDVYESWLYMSK